MDCYHGYSMIHQVLIKSKCIVGYHMLKVSHTLNSSLSSIHSLRWPQHWNILFFLPWTWSSPTHRCLTEPLWTGAGDPAVTWPSGCVCNWAVWWPCTEMDSVWLDETLSSCRVTQHLHTLLCSTEVHWSLILHPFNPRRHSCMKRSMLCCSCWIFLSFVFFSLCWKRKLSFLLHFKVEQFYLDSLSDRWIM